MAWLRDALRYGILCGGYGYRHLRHRHTLCWLGPTLAKVPILKDRAIYDLRELCPHFCDGTIIDVGCGGGAYLAMMRDLGWPVVGIEPDPAAAEVARSKGLTVRDGSLIEAQLPGSSAAQISLNHVIEHLPDPLQTIQECYRVLKPGGRLVVYTPNSSSLGHKLFRQSWLHLDPPRHLFLFSSKNIRRLIGRTFKKIRIGTTMQRVKLVYDSSSLIAERGKISLSDVVPRAGRYAFAYKEWLGCSLGMPWGEELEVVAIK
jgi:SAM-dependent methyltransferase